MMDSVDESLVSDDSFRLAPEFSERRPLTPALSLPQPDLSPPTDESDRVLSLRAILAAMTIAVLVLALGRRLPPAVFAFLCGLTSLATLVTVSLAGVRSATAKLIFWTLMALYAIAAWAAYRGIA